MVSNEDQKILSTRSSNLSFRRDKKNGQTTRASVSLASRYTSGYNACISPHVCLLRKEYSQNKNTACGLFDETERARNLRELKPVTDVLKMNYFVNTAVVFERDLSVVLRISVSFFRDISFLKQKWEEVFVKKKRRKKGQNEMKSLGNTGLSRRRSLSTRREKARWASSRRYQVGHLTLEIDRGIGVFNSQPGQSIP